MITEQTTDTSSSGIVKPLPQQPLVSILTVVYNGAAHLEETILSVMSQDYDNMEYVMIDGGSTDGTLDIIEQYRTSIDTFVSEPDDGIYDAINKGIRACKGQIIKIQNADDLLLPGAVSAVVKEFGDRPLEDAIILIGESNVIDANSKVTGRITEKKTMWGFDSFNHPAWFATAKIYKRFGAYSTDYQISADYEYYLRVKTQGGNILRMQRAVAAYRKGGASSGYTGVREVAQINYKYYGPMRASLVGGQHLIGKLLRQVKIFLLNKR